MANYKIRGSDQKEYGPVSAEVLRQWIAQGRVATNTPMLAEGTTEWKPMSEFPEFAAEKPAGGTPAPLAGAAAAGGPPKTGLAITSLILGILSLVGCAFLAGIPAVITGVMARSRASKSPAEYGGGGMALAGIVLGCIGTIITTIAILAGLTLPALAKAKQRAQTISCITNMKQIGLAARMWANENKEKFPPDFLSMSNELNTPKILVCPGDPKRSAVTVWDWSHFDTNWITYQFLKPGIEESKAMGEVIFVCPIHGNVGLGDGSVQQRGHPAAMGRKPR